INIMPCSVFGHDERSTFDFMPFCIIFSQWQNMR
ncbi:aldo/keto reductase, partial [Acinetobacter baumannii]|nr:aldo/keto reductase [Acinetobacter baumannii]